MEEASPDVLPKQFSSKAKTIKYDDTYLAFGFTCTMVGVEERPQDVTVLASYSFKPYKLRRHLETNHPEHKDEPIDFFRQKLVNCCAQQSLVTKAVSVPASAQLASYKVAYWVAQCTKPRTIAEELILPCAIDMVSIMIDESAASKLSFIPLSNNTISMCIYDLSKDIKEQLNEKVRDSRCRWMKPLTVIKTVYW